MINDAEKALFLSMAPGRHSRTFIPCPEGHGVTIDVTLSHFGSD
jgi:hypothetical protein